MARRARERSPGRPCGGGRRAFRPAAPAPVRGPDVAGWPLLVPSLPAGPSGRARRRTECTRPAPPRYRRELRRNLDLFESFLDTAEFVNEGTVGVELEMNLARADTMAPALISDLLLEDLDDEDYVHEIGRFNLEVNLPVTHPQGSGL